MRKLVLYNHGKDRAVDTLFNFKFNFADIYYPVNSGIA